MIRRALALAVALPWMAWAIVRTAGLDSGDPLVSIVAFTPYAALTAPLPVLLALTLRRWFIAAAAVVAALALAVAVLPRAVRDDPPGDAGSSRELTVMSLNLDDGHADAGAVMRLARGEGVDVLSLLELKGSALARLDSAGAARLFPSRAIAPRAAGGGSGLLSRSTLRSREPTDDASTDQPSARWCAKRAPAISFQVVHPPPPTNAADLETWQLALDRLPDGGARELRILVGDFNGTLDHRAIRSVLDRGYRDAAATAGAGLHGTWPVEGDGPTPRIAIDHVLADRGVGVRRFELFDIAGTDHRAIVAELTLPRSAGCTG